MLNPSDANRSAVVNGKSMRRRRGRISRGQTATEFALILTPMLMVLLVGVQFALIGQAHLALSQGASAIARYWAVNEGAVSPTYSGTPNAAMKTLLSDSILTNGGNDLTVTINSYKGGTTNTAATTPTTPTVDRAVVTLSYQLKTTNKNFLGGFITLPTSLSSSDSELYE